MNALEVRGRFLNDLDQGDFQNCDGPTACLSSFLKTYDRRDQMLDVAKLFDDPNFTSDVANTLFDNLDNKQLERLVDDLEAVGWQGPGSGGLWKHELRELYANCIVKLSGENLARLVVAYESPHRSKYATHLNDTLAAVITTASPEKRLDVVMALTSGLANPWSTYEEQSAFGQTGQVTRSSKPYMIAVMILNSLKGSPEFDQVIERSTANASLLDLIFAAIGVMRVDAKFLRPDSLYMLYTEPAVEQASELMKITATRNEAIRCSVLSALEVASSRIDSREEWLSSYRELQEMRVVERDAANANAFPCAGIEPATFLNRSSHVEQK